MLEFIGNFIAGLVKAPFVCAGWVIVGILAGALARRIVGGRGNLFSDLLLGIGGAIIGGFLSGLLGFSYPNGGLPLLIANLLVATVTAILLIVVGRAVRRSA
ncbi:MAG TPA: GlsB/YeaQ/YmgE family stress response membrane protein [Aggregatilineales bacterium]|nr:GlsB/YeaQ/YmgE family stress response membrane protein [Anaerolineales bacterium]HRE48083.1 GlsB/YeaQ/YmgE family stress response membrane protein [Aggregatilineales bacterium]